MNPFFSIITPTYNRGEELQRAGKSVFSQSFDDFEWIIIDDGSEDNTEEVLLNFNDIRLKYENLSKGKGINRSRNRGIDLAKGRYILFLDSDDELLPDALINLKKLWENADDKIGLILSIAGERKNNSRMKGIVLSTEDIICQRKVKGEYRISFRREVFENDRFDDEVFGCEGILYNRLARKWDFLFVKQPTIKVNHKRWGSGGVETRINKASEQAKGYEILIEENKDVWLKGCPGKYAHYINSLVLRYIISNQKKKARILLRKEKKSLNSFFLYLLSFLPRSFTIILYRLRYFYET